MQILTRNKTQNCHASYAQDNTWSVQPAAPTIMNLAIVLPRRKQTRK